MTTAALTRRGSLVLEPSGAIEIRLPHRLESPNKLLHAHWRTRTRDKQAWGYRLLTVLTDYAEHPAAMLGLEPVTDKRRVWIERQVPSFRNFIRDRENLTYCVKHLLDQIKYAGLIRDDSMRWIDLEVEQRVSDDGLDWTVLRIEPVQGEVQP